MIYVDYEWDLNPNYLKFDNELNLKQLNWNEGDLFVVKRVGDQTILHKVDDLEKFVKGYK
jgi:hypothetical protein